MRGSRGVALVALSCFAAATSACVFLDVKRQQELDQQVIRISGTVALAEPAEGLRVVVLVRMLSEDDGDVVDHYTRRQDGRFYFAVTDPGRYALAAFHDKNGDLTYDPVEPGVGVGEAYTFDLAAGESLDDVEIVIDPQTRVEVDGPANILELTARSAKEQVGRSIGQFTTAGEIFELGDPRFGTQSGVMGMWRPLDFIDELRPGIFFTEPYDPDRTPILFIHGMTGSPNEFEPLVEALDLERFQPWFYFYPSGVSLERVVTHVEQVLMTIAVQHHFRRLVVVAHSMGGLVGRGLVLELSDDDTVRLFVTLSTPWGGQASAQAGVDRAPAVVDSWRDMAPDSAFQRALFWEDPDEKTQPRRLPEHLSHHLIFGYQRDSASLGESSDGVVTLPSLLLPVAQEEAVEVTGIDATHAGILRDPATAAALNRILAEAER